MKKYVIAILLMIGIGCIVCIANPSTAAIPDGEHKVITAKHPGGVTHYGTHEYVTILDEYAPVESEMRGVWVATVYNIAISKQNGLGEGAIAQYQQEFQEILDRMEAFGMNTLFFQVRPCNDAFYQSHLNPWSKFLVGEGVDPGWDPLTWMIEETHKRGFRFMCWMNAFRVTTESYVTNGKAVSKSVKELVQMKLNTLNRLADGNFAKAHPEYVVAGLYDEKLILNPSEPAVQKFIVDTIMEIVEHYDVDGLHFDDYFYLDSFTSSDTTNSNFAGYDSYTVSGPEIMNDWPNYLAYQQDPTHYGQDVFGQDGYYGIPAGLNLGDFRRENINNMMRNIRKKIDEYNAREHTYVEFGTKPAAVWRSNSEYCSAGSHRCDPFGSNTAEGAYSTYADLYADSLQWVKEGLVDWVAPQVYYSFEDEYAPFADIVDWWAEQVEAVNTKRRKDGLADIRLYIAHGIYKYRDAPDQFYRSAEIIDQIKYTRHYPVIQGSAVYSYELLYRILGSDLTQTYPNAENVRKNAMKQMKDLWQAPVYPLPIGAYDATGLKVDTYQLKENSNGELSLQFATIPNVAAYGIYQVPKGMPFDAHQIEYRTDVIYAGYEEGQMKLVSLGTEDVEKDYYILPISRLGHISDTPTLLALETKVINQAPYPVEITLDVLPNQEVICGSILKGSFDIPTDPNQDQVDYTFYLYQSGLETKITPQIELKENQVHFEWKSYYYEERDCQIKVVLTDQDMTTDCYSPSFDLTMVASPISPTFEVDKMAYFGSGKISITYTEGMDSQGYPLTYQVFLVIDEMEVDITEDFLSGENHMFEVYAPNVTSTHAFIKCLTSNGRKTTISQSEPFSIEKVIPITGGKVSISGYRFARTATIMVDYTLPVIEESYKVNYYFLMDNQSYLIHPSQLSSYAFQPQWLTQNVSEHCQLTMEIITVQQVVTFSSDVFSLYENHLPTGGSLQINQHIYQVNDKMNVQAILPVDPDQEELLIVYYLVGENKKIKLNVDSNTNFTVTLTEIGEFHLEMEAIDASGEKVIVVSDDFAVRQKKGCANCKSTSILWFGLGGFVVFPLGMKKRKPE
ncbi:MAG: family 10 glycosylhydrolase [Anaeroplasma bactoclasticum]|nr:family 10 glycosylhydrolase [Anaeroplasma bactoclasticum]